MKNFTTKFQSTFTLVILLFITTIVHFGCNKSEEEPNKDSFTIAVGAFSLNNGIYTALGNELVFDSKEECQTWTRTAQGDAHSSAAHLHYNAAANVSYNSTDTIFSWSEFGPELDQPAIDATCSAGLNGVNKTVNTSSYYQDKPNVYLKITKVE